MAAMIRPSEMSARLSRSLAQVTGCRKLGDATQVPSLSVVVASAATVRVGTVAYQSSSARLRQARWS